MSSGASRQSTEKCQIGPTLLIYPPREILQRSLPKGRRAAAATAARTDCGLGEGGNLRRRLTANGFDTRRSLTDQAKSSGCLLLMRGGCIHVWRWGSAQRGSDSKILNHHQILCSCLVADHPREFTRTLLPARSANARNGLLC